jgi:hypothetical protein
VNEYYEDYNNSQQSYTYQLLVVLKYSFALNLPFQSCLYGNVY